MADTPSPSASLITDLIGRYGKQAVQLFTALAGATSLFYAIGFIIVNSYLLQLGVYETALISVGYIAPGVAFAIVFLLAAAGSALLTTATFAVLTPATLRRIGDVLPASTHSALGKMSRRTKYTITAVLSIAVMVVNLILIVAFSKMLGYLVWFGLNESASVTAWCTSVGLVVAGLLYAEYVSLLWQSFRQQTDPSRSLVASAQARLKLPVFAAALVALTFVSVLAYGRSVYGNVPSVFGGGLPIVVRFFGEKVDQLDRLGIGLEPGETVLTERVELITQTEDRYIVRVAGRAVSFDKKYVQGIRYEPPEFFFGEAFFFNSHTRLGEQFLADELYDNALSEFNLVLDRNANYAPALKGRIRIALIESRLDLESALNDYRELVKAERNNAENFYGLATVHARLAQPGQEEEAANEVVAMLQSARAISTTVAERAKDDAIFDDLRGVPAFDSDVYGSGSAAARWFAQRAGQSVESGAASEAIAAYQRAVQYAQQYQSDTDALSPIEIADLDVALSGLYDRFSTEALEAMRAAVAVTGERDPNYLNLLADLYRDRNEIDAALQIYDRVLQLSTAEDANRRTALIRQGQIALQAGDYLRAKAAFERALELGASDAATQYDYARVLAALGDAGAVSALRKAIELDSSLVEQAQKEDWPRYFANAGTEMANLINGAASARQARAARDAGDFEEAIAQYRQATDADPGIPAYWSELGDVLYRAEQFTEAAAAYQNALLLLPAPDANLLASVGRAQLKSGDAAGATNSFTAAINALGNTASADVYALLASAYEAAEKFDQAAAAYAEAARRESNTDLQIQYQYKNGVYLLLAGQTELGLAALTAATAQGGLRVESADASLRDATNAAANVLALLPVGAPLRIEGQPQLSEGVVWWPVSTQDGTPGFVRALQMVPGPPPEAPVSQVTAP